jgi:PRTRC genetic system protein A
MFANLIQHQIYRGTPIPLAAQAYDYLLAGNGVFKRAQSPHICAQIPVGPARVAGLPGLVVELAVRPGRIPDRLLYTVLADARRYAYQHREQMYQFRIERTAVRLIKPDQRAGSGTVVYQADSGAAIVCDLHSHHTMRAFFSHTDDADEQGFRFYAVIGDLLGRPAIKLRLGMYGDFLPLPVTALFTGRGPFEDLLDEEDIDYDDDNS